MGIKITEPARLAAEAIAKKPSLILEIDGLSTRIGSVKIVKYIKIGDPGLYIDSTWKIGGTRQIEDQLAAISFDDTSTSLDQKLEIDKAKGASISSMTIGLIDIGKKVTEIVSPGFILQDVLGRKARVLLGFDGGGAYPEDFIVVHRGIIDDIQSKTNVILVNIAAPVQKQRQALFEKVTTKLFGAIDNSQTTITLESTTGLLLPVNGPDGSISSMFQSHVIIENEIIKYTGISGNQITGCTRGAISTLAVAHDNETEVNSFYRLTGNSMDMALSLMLSKEGYYKASAPLTNFVNINDGSLVPNSIFFFDQDLGDLYGVSEGDYITTVGASNGANNVTLKKILTLEKTDFGTYIVIDGVSFVEEIDSASTISFRSRYDVLPKFAALGMDADEVDIAAHEELKRLFLSSFDLDFYLKEQIDDGKEFLETEIYKVTGSYSVPRDGGKASCKMHVGPIPGTDTIILDRDNIINPSRLKIRRTINKNMFNTIVYKFDESKLEDKLLKGVLTRNGDSLARIPIGTRALIVESKGMRESLLGFSLAQIASNRRLNRYKFGAEHLDSVNITYGVGFSIEIGDIVLLDGKDLELINTESADRNKPPKLFEVVNRKLNIKTGEVLCDLVDTSFSTASRYGLIAPASIIKTVIDAKTFYIEPSYGKTFGVNEFRKWSRFTLPAIKVVSPDYTTRFDQGVIRLMEGNKVNLVSNLGFTPQAGDIMTIADYDFAEVTEEIKLLYAHMRNSAFGDGKPQYNML